MGKTTKIMVFRLKEIIYTIIFVALGILLIFLLIHMFSPSNDDSPASGGVYTPGVYTSALTVGSQTVDVEVTVDADHINSIRLVNLSDSVTTMYPLMEPAIEDLADQILANQSTDNIVFPDSQKYTSSALLQAITSALDKAK
ncbi:hypothetical protein [Hominifimenecus sp. rT4P-3]|uniref:hypothetical protein n=1 Tax=Hominifimenecus sp. rT4P-3 TaxID=3242979 RepID=UPI003DA5F18F